MNKVELCFIGAGFHASTNIYPAAIEAGVIIKAIATRNISGATKALRRFGSDGKAYDDYKKMIREEKCDGVVIVAQPTDQFNIALACVEAGKNVFVDKPLGWTSDEAIRIHEASRVSGVKVMVGFMKRYAPAYKKVQDMIYTSEFGKVKSFNMNFNVDGTPFCPDTESYIKLAAIHIVDLVRFLFGEVSDLHVMNNNDGANINQCISLRCENGTVGNLYLTSMTAWSRESENLTVTFEHGFVQVEEINKIIVHQSKIDDRVSFASQTESDRVLSPSMTPMSGGLRDLYLRGFVDEMIHFSQCITGDEVPDSNSLDNISTMKLCEKILGFR